MPPRRNVDRQTERRTKQRMDGDASGSQAHPEELRYGYLLDNSAAAHRDFVQHFASRNVIKPKSLDMMFFAEEGFEIVPLLQASHLGCLAELFRPYSEDMVRVFYHNLSYVHGQLRSRVSGVDIVMTAPIWAHILQFDFDGAGTIEFDGDSTGQLPGFDRAAAVHDIRRPLGQRALFTVGQLTVDARILFYVMTHILFPRAYNHSRVLEVDIPIMWAINHAQPVNWRHYICWMMYKAKQKANAALPFAFLIQRILEHFRVPLWTEHMVEHTEWNAKFGRRLLEQCKISKNAHGVWVCTAADEDDAPVVAPVVEPEFPEPEFPGQDDDDDAEEGDMVEPDGGFSLRDVMKQMRKMDMRQKKHNKRENERWRWMHGQMRGLQDGLRQLQVGQGQEAAGEQEHVPDVSEDTEEEDTEEEEED